MKLNSMLYEKDGDIAIMTFNRPKVMNAIDETVLEDIETMLDEIAKDDDIKVVILAGSPKVFVAGGDIAHMLTVTPVACETFIAETHRIFNKLADFDKPVIAAISGLAFGGGLEVALCCDFRIAAEGTMLGTPEVNLGLFPGGGGTQRLTRMVGISWAKDMVLTGEPIDVQTAQKIGLVTRIFAVDTLMDEAKKMAKKLAAKAPITTRVTKQSLNNSIYSDMQTGLKFEQKAFAYIFATEDHTEGCKAFMEKRPPVFLGK